MINLDLNITIRGINTDAEEKVRLALRKAALSFVFSECEKAFEANGLAFNHTDITVDGEITLKDPK